MSYACMNVFDHKAPGSRLLEDWATVMNHPVDMYNARLVNLLNTTLQYRNCCLADVTTCDLIDANPGGVFSPCRHVQNKRQYTIFVCPH